MAMEQPSQFALGVNYWPRSSAMYWWSNYDCREVQEDFQLLAQTGLRVIRIFLNWEDFQPFPEFISEKPLENLVVTADLAGSCGLKLIPTFFCGHMCGVNWLPPWLLDPTSSSGSVPTFSGGELTNATVADFFSDPSLLEAQLFQIATVAQALKGHSAIYAYDLGNETSNCRIPCNSEQFASWLGTLSSHLRRIDPLVPITFGLHAQDLEQDRNMHPQIVASFCDFLSMHAYPFSLSWVQDQLDPLLPVFCAMVTAWLGQKPVLMAEWGAPTLPVIAPLASDYRASLNCPLWREEAVGDFYRASLSYMQKAGLIGALAWCFADYAPGIWNKPPLSQCRHERHFGLLRHDGSPKKSLAVFESASAVEPQPGGLDTGLFFHDFTAATFYHDPIFNLFNMFTRFKLMLKEQIQ